MKSIKELEAEVVRIARYDGDAYPNGYLQALKDVLKLIDEDKILVIDSYELAKLMHDKYEEISKELGWDTQKKCKVEFEDLPEKNRNVMINIAIWIISYFSEIFEKEFEELKSKING